MPVSPVNPTAKPTFVPPSPAAACDSGVASAVRPQSREWHRLARRAKTLSWVSLGWLAVEAGLSVIAAIVAGSVALLAFGIDSGIEALASVIVIWRFSGSRTVSETSERTAQRLVAVSFFLLAPYVAAESVRALVFEQHAESTWLGIVTALVSLMWCPALGAAKQRIGRRLGSSATAGEGRQNLLCAYMALAVLVGLIANTVAGIWWLDPVAGLLIAALAVKEGAKAWQGQTCSCCT